MAVEIKFPKLSDQQRRGRQKNNKSPVKAQQLDLLIPDISTDTQIELLREMTIKGISELSFCSII